MTRSIFFLLAALLLSACDSNDAGTPIPDPTPPDSVIAGVNLNQLFSDPTGAERAAVQTLWSTRNHQLPVSYNFTLEATLTGSDGAELKVYAGREPGSGGVFFYGLVRLPIRLPGDVRQRATLLVLPDGDNGVSDGLISSGGLPFRSDIHEEFVYAMVAYRGETLRVGNQTFTPDAIQSAYDLETDDALAFVEHVYGSELLADPNRVGVLGIGRGGGVALLAASRSSSFDLVIDIAGPANFFSESFKTKTRSILTNGVAGSFPGLQSLADQVIFPLRDGSLSMADARVALLQRSPSHFVSPPPFIFVAHGILDFVVHIDHSRSIGSIAGTPSALYLEVEEAGHTTILSDNEVVSLMTNFLVEHLIGS